MLQRVLSAVRAGNHTAAVARPSAVTHPAVTHLRQATPEEIADGATCRFCFDNTTDEKLIAPCACQGSQLWVHHACLVRWQKASMRAQTGHELVCSVCNTAYALPPPVMPPSPVRAGMLLVASADLHGTFHQSVILLCEVNARGAHGVIINYHIEPVAGSMCAHAPVAATTLLHSVALRSCTSVSDWRLSKLIASVPFPPSLCLSCAARRRWRPWSPTAKCASSGVAVALYAAGGSVSSRIRSSTRWTHQRHR